MSFERYPEEDDDLLEEVHLEADSAVVRLKTIRRTYEPDVRKLDRSDLLAMDTILRKMNFDGRVQLSGI